MASDCNHTATSFKYVKYIRNYDADTISLQIPNVHPIIGEKISIRVYGGDTPEIKEKTDCEKKKAKDAKHYIEKILKKAKRIDLVNIKSGKYFRVVADVIVDGKSISELIIKNRFGYSYFGKTKKKINLCKSLKKQ